METHTHTHTHTHIITQKNSQTAHTAQGKADEGDIKAEWVRHEQQGGEMKREGRVCER